MGEKRCAAQFSRRFLLGALLGSAAGRAFANPPLTSIRPQPRRAAPKAGPVRGVEDLIAESRLSGRIAFALADARTGEMLEVHNPLLSLPPASVTKVITALYALEKLGPNHRFRTRLLATGPVTSGKLNGDLVLVGGSDPTLDTDALGDLAKDLKATGLRKITGKFLVYSSSLPTIHVIDPDQPEHVGYNPTISGLNLNYNRVHFEWKRAASGYEVSMDARAVKYRPSVAIARMQVVDRVLPVYTYSDNDGIDSWTVAKAALGKAGSRWLPVRRPDLYAAEVFQALARSHGIALPRAQAAVSLPNGTLLVERTSPNLHDVLKDMLLWSTNLTAEVVGLTASQADGKGARSLQASAEAMSTWAKKSLGAGKARFVDHSGLADQSRIGAADMVKALIIAHRSGVLGPMLKSIPMRDAKGNVIGNHPTKVKAKTGTLNFVSDLAGYLTGADGRELAFAILTADLPRRDISQKSEDEIPPGGRAWTARSRQLQMQLIERWGLAYAS